MLCTKSRFLKISSSIFYSLIILFSIFVIAIKLYKLNWPKLLNKFCYFAVKISAPELCEASHKNDFLDKFENSEQNQDYENNFQKYSQKDFQNENKSCFSDIPENFANYKILETQFGKSGTKCSNFYIKNKTGKNINFDKYFNKKPRISIKNKKKILVLIYHTHTSESYIEKNTDIIPKNFNSRTQDNNKNIVAVGKKLAETLKKNGISVIHDTTVHDFPNYNGAYNRSAATIKKYINKYSQIPIIIDLHRDSIGDSKAGRIKPVFRAKNNKKAAQIMLVCGCGINKSLKFSHWEKNLSLALNLQNICEEKFPGLTRELIIKNVVYNQNLTPGATLIEVGSDVNTLEESNLAAQMLGESIFYFLKKFAK
jgi:stage II sporulation protein P